jgi:hypothetical protein
MKSREMKLHYDSPTADVLLVNKEDIIKTSGRDYSGEWDTDF